MNKPFVSIASVLMLGLILAQSAQAQTGTDIAYLIEITDTSFLPSTIYAGDIVSLAVEVKDKGNFLSIADLRASLDLGGQFEAVQMEDEIPLILKGTTKTLIFKFRVKEDTIPGYYPGLITMTYIRGDTEIEMTETQSVTVPVSKTEKNLDVTLEPGVINPGNQTEIVFTIKNVAGTPVSNLSFSWEEENNLVLPVGSNNKRHVSVLRAGEEAKVSYVAAADPNITTGIYPLNVTISFTDIDGTQTQESQVGLIVGGKTDFEVSAEMLSTGQVSISIANVGSNNADAVVVRIPDQAGVTVSGSTASILGNLNKGDFTLANFQMRVTSNQERQFPTGNRDTTTGAGVPSNRGTLLVEIDYTDTTGERQKVEKELELNTVFSETTTGTETYTAASRFSRQRGADNSYIAWALLATLLVGAAGFNRFKAGNKKWKRLGKVLGAIATMFIVVIFPMGSNILAAIAAAMASALLLGWYFSEKHVERALGKARQFFKKQKE
ncbi:MAG: COG1361 S-layer family protein [Candidatus Diapherotrites archaeon]|uniref:COG1361 S-layer family protein n=1 Tax=Candidatus Iainarchaeum sp. TaxID=3101447 RepID=A0A938YPM6_9ARCH|nr:COG1361 S-layer family protein [Candidatus Diapherotrites archaeon]